MTNSEIIIATITWARDEQESNRLNRAIEALASQALPVVVADGGSRVEFVNSLKQYPNIIFQPYQPTSNPRLLGQVKSALSGASQLKPQYVLYTEPDKQWFFEHQLKTFVTQATVNAPLGVGIAARSEASFLTYPAFQQYTETVTSRLCAEVIGQIGDVLYGPLLLNPRLLPYVEQLNEDVGWGWRLFVMVIAHRLGLPVRYITLDLPCPAEQREEDDQRARLYRMEQLSHNAKGLVVGAKWSLD